MTCGHWLLRLGRAWRTGGAECGKIVDGRHKAGHDTVGTTVPPARYLNAYAGVPRPFALRRRGVDGRDTPGHDGEATAAAIFSHRGAGAAGWPALWKSALALTG